jgi:hypothetical protein
VNQHLLKPLNLDAWDVRYRELVRSGLVEPVYGGPLSRHVTASGDHRLERLRFDGSPAALRLWNFLLTENERLRHARAAGDRLVGVMKDLGTVPVMAYALEGLRAFYPDGTWWTPCLMEETDCLLSRAEALGIDASFCPVRAMLAAFKDGGHFPRPDLLICSAGAVCDDFSAIAQRLEKLGFQILWWEMPRRRAPEPGEAQAVLPGEIVTARELVECVREELARVGKALGDLAGKVPSDAIWQEGVRAANQVRGLLAELRRVVYGARVAPLPALEMLIAEMLAIHYCSDRKETVAVLTGLLGEARRRLRIGAGVVADDAVRVFWVNPVADLRAMNLLEEWGGCLCGSDFMFTHALDPIPEDIPPLEALAQMALADPMVGPAADRAVRVVHEARAAKAEAVVVARIPGASHSATEGRVILESVRHVLGIPGVEVEIAPVCDAMQPTLAGRLQALLETARTRRVKKP